MLCANLAMKLRTWIIFLEWSIVEIQNDIFNEVSRILMFLLIEIGLFSIRPYIDNYKNMEHNPTSKENALKF